MRRDVTMTCLLFADSKENTKYQYIYTVFHGKSVTWYCFLTILIFLKPFWLLPSLNLDCYQYQLNSGPISGKKWVQSYILLFHALFLFSDFLCLKCQVLSFFCEDSSSRLDRHVVYFSVPSMMLFFLHSYKHFNVLKMLLHYSNKKFTIPNPYSFC